MPTVSVIIPTYNYAEYLPQAIESALSQATDHLHVHVVVVDDGSTDNTGAVLDEYSDRVVGIRQSNQGLSQARNRGLAEVEGTYVAFLDADDLFGEAVLAAQLAFLESRPECGVSICRNTLFSELDADGRPVPAGSWNLFADDLAIHLCHFNIAPPNAFFARRECLGDLRFDASLGACEDHWFWFSLLANGVTFEANPAGMVYYRRHAESMSANLARQHRHDAEMHQRIFRELERAPEGMSGDAGSRFLACCAGALWTRARIMDVCPDEGAELENVASQALRHAETLGFIRGALSDWLLSRLMLAVSEGGLLSTLGESVQALAGPLPKGESLKELATSQQHSLHLG